MSNFTVYRSSAGSGKTHTLVKEYIRLAISGRDYAKRFARILAITFTNKAAGEMKERVIKNLYTLKLDPAHPEFRQDYLDEMVAFCGMDANELRRRAGVVFTSMLHNYHLLKITTIDKFTVSLVYSFARDLKVDAEHEIVTDVNEIIDAGIRQLIDQSGRDHELTNMFVDFLGFEMEEGNRFNVHRELRKFSEKVLDEKGYEALAISGVHTEEEFIEAGKQAAGKLNEIDNQVEQLAKRALEKIRANGLTADDFFNAGRGNYSLLVAVAKKGFYAIEEKDTVTKFISQDKRWSSKMAKDKLAQVEPLGNELAGIMQQLLDIRKKEIRNYIIHSTVRKNAFSMALFKRLHAAIEEYKTGNSLMLLSEFTQKVAAIVAQEPAPFIYERLGERVKNIFVDEFQDTSSLQFSNLVPLMEESLGKNEFVMLVGDAKQSIYRWRNGHVEQFVDLPALPEVTTKNNKFRQPVFNKQFLPRKLPVNYRSLQNVVEFNNSFFNTLINHPAFASEKASLAYKDVAQEFVAKKTGGYVRFELLAKEKNVYEPGETEEEENEADAAVDFAIKTVKSCTENGYNYCDIAILVRSHREGSRIFTGLRKKNIPVISNQAMGLDHSLEIKSVMHLFACLHHPPSVTRLRQFAYSYARSLDKYPAYERAVASIDGQTTFQQVLAVFDIRFKKSVFESLNLFEQVYYLAHVLGYKPGNAFLSAFYELVFGFFRKNGSNPGLFMEWWEQNVASFKLQTNEASNSVKIVTIHKSKGLQYPVVVLPFVNADVKPSDKYFWLKKVPLYNIKPLPVQYGKALGDTDWNEEYETEKRRSAFDVINLLYVAFTRAEEQLFCLAQYNPKSADKNPLTWTLSQMGWDQQSPGFTSGTPVKKTGNDTGCAVQAAETPGTREFSSWYNKIKVSTHLVSEKHRSSKQREKGIIMHELASFIRHQGQVKNYLAKFMAAGKIEESEQKLVEKSMLDFFASGIFTQLYDTCSHQLTEMELCDGQGHVLRPDRVFLFENKTAVVVDLKTGDEDESHHRQLRQYGAGIRAGGYTVDALWIYYFKNARWIKVDATAAQKE